MEYKWFPSPSYTHDSHSVTAIILHTTEGATTNDSIKNYLTGSNGVSYHGSVDNFMDGICYEYVLETDKSWSCCNFNGSTLNYVFCTPPGASANWSRSYWLDQQALMIRNMAQVVADQADQWNVPLTALSSSQAQAGVRGVAQHMNLGADGCGHSDCGTGFPMDELIRLAKSEPVPVPPQPVPAPFTDRDENMGAITEHPHVVPVPAGVKTFTIASDVAAQNVNHVVCLLRFHYSGEGNHWQEVRADLVVERPFLTYSTNARDVVSMTMEDPNLMAGYSFS